MDAAPRFSTIVKILLGIFLGLAVLMALRHPFNHDEFEHLHAAWNMQHGLRPYVDFFEHHHPLIWYFLLPILWIFGETTTAVLAARFLMLGCLLVIGRQIFVLTGRIFRTPGARLFAVAFLFSNVLFVYGGVEVRPDVPQLLLILGAVLELAAFEKDGKNGRLPAAAFLSSLAFLFLQKTVLFLFAAAVAWLWRRRDPGAPKPPARTKAAAAAAFLTPIGLFLSTLWISGALPDYWACSWLFNLNRGSSPRPALFFLMTFAENFLHYALGLAVFVLVVRGKWGKRIPLILPATILVCGAAPFLLGSPYAQYFLLPVALLSVLCGGFLAEALPRFRGRALVPIFVLFLALPPAVSFGIRAIVGNRAQIKLVGYVLRNTTPADCVYDGRAEFNVFRRDIHYFWFMEIFGRPEEKIPSRLQARRADFDPARLVTELHPAFISDVGLDPSSPEISAFYAPTKFRKPRYPANLYRRLFPPIRGNGAD